MASCVSGQARARREVHTPFTSAATSTSRQCTVRARAHPVSERQGKQSQRPWHTLAASTAAAILLNCAGNVRSADASARPEPVNKPELLPDGPVQTVVDVAGFLTAGEESRIKSQINGLEKDTGYRLRVLAQNYPNTPGLAVRDYWKVDDNTIVFVADPTFGDMLNFNVGAGVDLQVPQSFWSRLAGKFGTKGFYQKQGEEAAIKNAVSAINTCLREEPGRFMCSKVQGDTSELN